MGLRPSSGPVAIEVMQCAGTCTVPTLHTLPYPHSHPMGKYNMEFALGFDPEDTEGGASVIMEILVFGTTRVGTWGQSHEHHRLWPFLLQLS